MISEDVAWPLTTIRAILATPSGIESGHDVGCFKYFFKYVLYCYMQSLCVSLSLSLSLDTYIRP